MIASNLHSKKTSCDLSSLLPSSSLLLCTSWRAKLCDFQFGFSQMGSSLLPFGRQVSGLQRPHISHPDTETCRKETWNKLWLPWWTWASWSMTSSGAIRWALPSTHGSSPPGWALRSRTERQPAMRCMTRMELRRRYSAFLWLHFGWALPPFAGAAEGGAAVAFPCRRAHLQGRTSAGSAVDWHSSGIRILLKDEEGKSRRSWRSWSPCQCSLLLPTDHSEEGFLP